jgi:hypothetical protein
MKWVDTIIGNNDASTWGDDTGCEFPRPSNQAIADQDLIG